MVAEITEEDRVLAGLAVGLLFLISGMLVAWIAGSFFWRLVFG